jgi:5'-nucleotidase
MQKQIIVRNQTLLEATKKVMKKGGAHDLHVLADFDRTLTTALVDGKNVPSLISLLRDGNYLTPDYAEKAHALFDTYHPIEIDQNIPFDEKSAAMEEWWRKHFALLITSGLNKSDIEKAVASGKVRLREGFDEVADLLHLHNVPFVIMSASGLGSESIALYLEHAGKLHDNVHIICNEYEWDEAGHAVGVHEPIIHGLNKHETAIQDYPAFDAVRERRNVVLLGDSVNDIGMVQGFDYDHLITIGFLNDRVEEHLAHFQEVFDVVLTGDPSMTYVSDLLREIV